MRRRGAESKEVLLSPDDFLDRVNPVVTPFRGLGYGHGSRPGPGLIPEQCNSTEKSRPNQSRTTPPRSYRKVEEPEEREEGKDGRCGGPG